jgi:hypothetical protein
VIASFATSPASAQTSRCYWPGCPLRIDGWLLYHELEPSARTTPQLPRLFSGSPCSLVEREILACCVDHAEQLRHCLNGRLIAIGWGAELPTGSSLDDVCAWIEQNPAPGWGRRAVQTVRRFAEEAEIGEFTGRATPNRTTGSMRRRLP